MSKFVCCKMLCARIFLVTFTVLCIQTCVGDGSINYCGAKMCAHTNAHTFCRYPPGPNPSCMGYMDARLSTEEKARVMGRLNRRRSEVAKGVRGLPAAGDMLKLRWVEELAREAQRWADQCQPPNTPEYCDACRDLYAITVGQCVASVVGEAPGLRPETMVDVWYMQSMQYKGNISSYTPSENANNYYEDYAQMIWSRAFMVGCGRSRFMTPWNGRLRSVERLVCNFAPRGPPPLSALWSAAPPASACPPRSRPDADLPALCSYHYNLDETYDEDSTMRIEEHLLLNTILEIERNVSLDYFGSIDEFYLTKLAVATIENPMLTLPTYNPVQKRDILEKLEIESETTHTLNQTQLNVEEQTATDSNLKVKVNKTTLKKKASFVGRPKTYNIDDLNDADNQKINNDDKVQDTTTVEKDVYDDYAFIDIQEAAVTAASTTKEIVTLNIGMSTEREQNYLNITDITSTMEIINPISFANITHSYLTSSTQSFEKFLNYMISNLTIPQILNESAIDSNILDDYLSDPDTVRQLQDALDRLERNLAGSSTAGKVRRELRNLQSATVAVSNDNPNRKSNHKLTPEELNEIERNKTLDRGPMINMVLKYMPYLKTYEKSIMGDNNVNSGSLISPSFVLFLAFYF